MSEKIYDVSPEWAKRAFVDQAKYRDMYARSISDPKGFWAEQAKRVDWIKPFSKVENTSYAPGNISIKWFEDGVLNVAWNCIDRHLEKRGDQTAIIWEGDNPSESKHITYRQLHDEVCKMANIPRVVGYERDGRGFLLSDKLLPRKEKGKFVPTPIVKYYMGLAHYLGSQARDLSLKLFVTESERRGGCEVLERAGLPRDVERPAASGKPPLILLNPGAQFGSAVSCKAGVRTRVST